MPNEQTDLNPHADESSAPPAPRWLHGLNRGPQPPLLFELTDGPQRREARVHDEVRIAMGDLSIYVRLASLSDSTATGIVIFLGDAPYPSFDRPQVGDSVIFALDRILMIL